MKSLLLIVGFFAFSTFCNLSKLRAQNKEIVIDYAMPFDESANRMAKSFGGTSPYDAIQIFEKQSLKISILDRTLYVGNTAIRLFDKITDVKIKLKINNLHDDLSKQRMAIANGVFLRYITHNGIQYVSGFQIELAKLFETNEANKKFGLMMLDEMPISSKSLDEKSYLKMISKYKTINVDSFYASHIPNIYRTKDRQLLVDQLQLIDQYFKHDALYAQVTNKKILMRLNWNRVSNVISTDLSYIGDYPWQNEKAGEAPIATNNDTASSTKPYFIGGIEALRNYMNKSIVYPEDALINEASGSVVVQFAVETDGSVTDIEIVQSLTLSCDYEVVKMVRAMPKWRPAKSKGIAVKSYVILPVQFVLEEIAPKK